MSSPAVEAVRNWRLRNADKMAEYDRRAKLKRNYGMTPDDYDAQLAEQGGRCAICFTDDPAPRTVFAVDHDHETGNIRGLLCPRCNLGIGQFRDDPELVASALTYLGWRPWVVPQSHRTAGPC